MRIIKVGKIAEELEVEKKCPHCESTFAYFVTEIKTIFESDPKLHYTGAYLYTTQGVICPVCSMGIAI